MNDFFGFLLALLTFDWLRDRRVASANADALGMMLAIKWECADCEDDVYLDGTILKHVSTRTVMRATPHGQPHPANAYLPPLEVGSESWLEDATNEEIEEAFANGDLKVTDNSVWTKR